LEAEFLFVYRIYLWYSIGPKVKVEPGVSSGPACNSDHVDLRFIVLNDLDQAPAYEPVARYDLAARPVYFPGPGKVGYPLSCGYKGSAKGHENYEGSL